MSVRCKIQFGGQNAYNIKRLCSQVKAEKPQMGKVLQECWKLSPAPNGLTYTTYVYGGDGCYHTRKDVGKYYTVTKGLLESL